MSEGVEVGGLEAYTLKQVFSKYCKYGSLGGTDLTLTWTKFEKLVHDCGLAALDNSSAVRNIFIECSCGQPKLEFPQFLQAIGHLASRAFPRQKFNTAVSRLLREHVFALVSDSGAILSTLHCATQQRISTSHRNEDTQSERETLTPLGSPQSSASVATTNTSKTWTTTSTGTICTLSTSQVPSCLRHGCGSPGDETEQHREKDIQRTSQEEQTVQLNAETVLALQQIFQCYSAHWCCGFGRQRSSRSLRAKPGKYSGREYQYDHTGVFSLRKTVPSCRLTESMLKVQTRYRWTNRMCYGGFMSFVCDFQIVQDSEDADNQLAKMAFVSALASKSEAPAQEEQEVEETQHQPTPTLEELYCFGLEFSQFLSAVTSLAVCRLRRDQVKEKGYLAFGQAVRGLLDKCLSARESLFEKQCDKHPALCGCGNHQKLVELERSFLPRRFQQDESACQLIQNALEPLRNIFVYYSEKRIGWSSGVMDDNVMPCRGGGVCGSPAPMLSEEAFLTLSRDFDLNPWLLSDYQFRSLFRTAQGFGKPLSRGRQSEPMVSARPMEYRVSFPQFVALLAHCTAKGLSRYPYESDVSTALEKISLVLTKMQISKGMEALFKHLPSFFLVHPGDVVDKAISNQAERKEEEDSIPPLLEAVAGLDSIQELSNKIQLDESRSIDSENIQHNDNPSRKREDRVNDSRTTKKPFDRKANYERALRKQLRKSVSQPSLVRAAPKRVVSHAKKSHSPAPLGNSSESSRPVLSLFPRQAIKNADTGLKRAESMIEFRQADSSTNIREANSSTNIREADRRINLRKADSSTNIREADSSTNFREADSRINLRKADSETASPMTPNACQEEAKEVDEPVSSTDKDGSDLEESLWQTSQCLDTSKMRGDVGAAQLEVVERLIALSRKVRSLGLEEKLANM